MVRPSTVTLLFALGGLVAGPALADDLFKIAKQRDRYNLARKTCLEARDYTVN